jgi:hypothetical protein
MSDHLAQFIATVPSLSELTCSFEGGYRSKTSSNERGLKMARTKTASRAQNRRGSPEAIEKRKAARMFNDVLGGRGALAQRLDGRTEKRRQRLLKELEEGSARGSRELKPLDILQHVQELLELGEPLGSIRKVVKVRKNMVAPDAVADVVERLHKAYAFRPEVYRFVGIAEEALRAAGVLSDESARKRAPKKK